MEMYNVKILSGDSDRFEVKILGTSFMSGIQAQLAALPKNKVEKVQPDDLVILEELNRFYRAKIIAAPDDDSIQCTLIDHNKKIDVGIDQIFVSNSSINRIPPRILVCKISTELKIKEEDWRRLIKRNEFDWKIQIVSNHSGGVAVVNLFRLGPENTVEKREVNFHDLIKFINDPESVSVGLLTLKRLNNHKIYCVDLKEQEDTESVNVRIVERLDGEMDLNDLYSSSPYSPPGPVSPGSLIIAPFNGNLFRAKVHRILGPELDLVVEFLDCENLDIVSWWDCHNMYEYLNFPRRWFTVQLPPYILGQAEIIRSVSFIQAQSDSNYLFYTNVGGNPVLIEETHGSGDEDISQCKVKDDTGDLQLHGSCQQNGSAGDHDCFEERNSSDGYDFVQGHLFNPLKTQSKDVNRNNDLISEVEWRKDLVSEVNSKKDLVSKANRNKDLVSEMKKDTDLVPKINRKKDLVSEASRNKDLFSEVKSGKDLVSEVDLNGNVNGNKFSVSSGIQSKKFASAVKMSQEKVCDTNGDDISSKESKPSNSDPISKNITNKKDTSVKSSPRIENFPRLNKSPEPEESTTKVIAEDSEININVYRAYLSAPKTSVRIPDLQSWGESIFGPMLNVRVLNGLIWMDFKDKSSLEKCVSNKQRSFRGSILELKRTEIFPNEQYNLSICVSHGGSEAEVRKFFLTLGEVKSVKWYTPTCSVVRFGTKSIRDEVLLQASASTNSSNIMVRRYGDRAKPTKPPASRKGHKEETVNLSDIKVDPDKDQIEASSKHEVLSVEEEKIDNIAFAAKSGTLTVNATLAESPDRIWLVDDDRKDMFLSMDLEIQSYAASSAPDESIIAPGNFCLGRIKEIDDRWYRCCILEIKTQSVLVFSVDTGHTVTIPRGNVKRLPRSLVLLPRQAFAVKLMRIIPAGTSDGTWTRTATNQLNEILFRPHIQVSADIKDELEPGIYSGDIKCMRDVMVDAFESREKVADLAGYLIKKGVAFKNY